MRHFVPVYTIIARVLLAGTTQAGKMQERCKKDAEKMQKRLWPYSVCRLRTPCSLRFAGVSEGAGRAAGRGEAP